MSEHTGIKWAPDLRTPGQRSTTTLHATEQNGSIPAEPGYSPSSKGRDLSLTSSMLARDREPNKVQPSDEQSQTLLEGYSDPQNEAPSITSTPVSPEHPDSLTSRAHSLNQTSLGLPLGTSIASGVSSTRTSSSSLKGLSERDREGSMSSLRRALSAKSSQGHTRGRRTSHSKSASTSQTFSKKFSNPDHPVYPDQSFEALQHQFRPTIPLRTRSSHPAQNLLYNDMSTLTKSSRDRASRSPGVRSVDHTPISTPGLFNFPSKSDASLENGHHLPRLHHLQAPKETHSVEIEHDTYSGNKFINNYEIVTELGRGEHGKVKLGRDIEKDTMVAVKIVPRYSAKRRLGRLGAPEDRTKREVAILKKARHAHVVSLLEVIDDPNKNKVYLILEYVEKGEIQWRKFGVREILAVNNARFVQEKAGIRVGVEVHERDLYTVAQAKRRHEHQERFRSLHTGSGIAANWSLEHGDETEEEWEEEGLSDISRSASRRVFDSKNPSRTNSNDDHSQLHESALAGSMYGAYAPEAYRQRKMSIAMSAISHMSSEVNFDDNDDEHSYVPAMTLEEARRAFRDTLLGLEFLHYIGIIHRDIKPANLLVASNGAVKISDFGVSYLGRPLSDEDPDSKLTEKDASALDDEKELARSVGTPAFWAPELCFEDPSMFEEKAGPKITGALDLWALGITLYCMVYARLPFYANDEMGLHEAVCTADVFLPKTRLVPVEVNSDGRVINSNKRLDYELKFEQVPDSLRDLIRGLLIKDPVKRMTIFEAKKHPWVVEGMADVKQFMKGPELDKVGGKPKILEVNEKEISHAVSKRNIIAQALTSAGRFATGLLGRRDTRKRASSAATSASHSSESITSPGSSTSTVGKEHLRESRRASLRGDEFIHLLKASREEHPLAQSQTASPIAGEEGSYFDKADAYGDDSQTTQESSPRPRGPDRTISAMSNAESIATVRAYSGAVYRGQIPDMHQDLDTSFGPDLNLRSKVEGLWEGTTKAFARLSNRDQRSRPDEEPSWLSRQSSESDAHTAPSLAVDTASASGAIQAPEILSTETSSSLPSAVMSPLAAPESLNHRHTAFQPPESDPVAFEHAQDINQRRLIMEAKYEAEAAAAAAAKSEMHPADIECPPSPDDITFLEKQRSSIPNDISPHSLEEGISTAPSASTIASSVGDYVNSSSVSQNMSNPSFGIISGASSPPGDGFLSAEYKAPAVTFEDPPFMRTADTITEHGRPKYSVATGKALEERHPDYDNHDYGDDEEDSEEEGMMMGGPKRKL